VNLRKARGSRGVLVSRSAESVLTDDFEVVWPDVADRLRAMLRRRGVQHHDIDEIVQETATRAISTRVPYDDADHLFRWASVVSGRLAIDLRRRVARLSDDELPDRADTIDVAMAAEHRVVLGAVRTRLPELSLRDQAVLLSTFHDEPSANRRDSVRVAVARHRARNRLRLLMDGLAGSPIVLWLRRNRMWSVPVEAISYAAAPTAACLLITVGAWSGLSNDRANGVPLKSSPTVQSVSIVPTSTVPRLTGPTGPLPTEPSPPSTPRPVAAPIVPDHPYVIAQDPTGETRAGVRDKEPMDHLWCVTTPSLSGLETRCFDSPVPLPATP